MSAQWETARHVTTYWGHSSPSQPSKRSQHALLQGSIAVTTQAAFPFTVTKAQPH